MECLKLFKPIYVKEICGRVNQLMPQTTTAEVVSTTISSGSDKKAATTTEKVTSTSNSSPRITMPMSTCLIEFGASYSGTNLSAATAANVFDCCNYCGVIPNCVAFIYQNTTSICSLKSSISSFSERVADPTMTFGKVQLKW